MPSRGADGVKSPVVAVTGSPGSGKSTVAQVFESLGARLIEADKIGHRLLERAEVKEHLTAWLGEGILDQEGNISRPKMASLLFGDREKLTKYDAFIHPLLLTELREMIAESARRSDGKMIVIDAALIYEWGFDTECDAVVVVSAPLEERIVRCMRKFGESREGAIERMNSQIPQQEKAAKADFIIKNHGGIDELRKRAEKVYSELKESL